MEEEEIVAGGIPEYDRAANGLIVRYFKGHDKGKKPTESALPWPAPGKGPKVKPGGADPRERKRKEKPAAEEAEEDPAVTVSRLKKELSTLKAALGKPEAPKDAKAMKKDKKEKARREKSAETRSRSGKRKRPFEGGGLARTAGGGDPGDEPRIREDLKVDQMRKSPTRTTPLTSLFCPGKPGEKGKREGEEKTLHLMTRMMTRMVLVVDRVTGSKRKRRRNRSQKKRQRKTREEVDRHDVRRS